MKSEIKDILQAVKEGKMSVDDAVLKLKMHPYEDIDFAKIDLHRKIRQGNSEVIYGAGKTSDQIVKILDTMENAGQKTVLITRLSKEKADEVKKAKDINYFGEANVAVYGKFPKADGIGKVVVATGGTSDVPVAEEAAITLEVMGNEVVRLYDVGVAGLHRLMSHLEEIMDATTIIAIAGMEGALASVIGGLADCPVIAVPTSVGYGASFGGVSALLSMLNSCANAVSVVNIDNGFGAACIASRINHMDLK